jgi:hypothetical protein
LFPPPWRFKTTVDGQKTKEKGTSQKEMPAYLLRQATERAPLKQAKSLKSG